MLQRKLNRRLDKSELFADIVALAFEFVGEDALDFVQLLYRVGELDFPASAGFLFFKEEEDFRREYVSSQNG